LSGLHDVDSDQSDALSALHDGIGAELVNNL
jgi:hypothetical protein